MESNVFQVDLPVNQDFRVYINPWLPGRIKGYCLSLSQPPLNPGTLNFMYLLNLK